VTKSKKKLTVRSLRNTCRRAGIKVVSFSFFPPDDISRKSNVVRWSCQKIHIKAAHKIIFRVLPKNKFDKMKRPASTLYSTGNNVYVNKFRKHCKIFMLVFVKTLETISEFRKVKFYYTPEATLNSSRKSQEETFHFLIGY